MGLFHEPRPELAPVRRALGLLLADVERGAVQIRAVSSRAGVHVGYETSNGWKLYVFNDAGYWDYLESAIAPDGSALDFDEIQGVEGVDWKDVSEWKAWGTILNYYESDPDFSGNDMQNS